MKERTERVVELGYLRPSDRVVEEIERTAERMKADGWFFLESRTDVDFRHVTLVFEREITV